MNSGAMIFQDVIFLTLGSLMLYAMHGMFHDHDHGDGHAEEAAPAPAEDEHGEHQHVDYMKVFYGLCVLTLIELAVPPIFGKGYSIPLILLMSLAIAKAWLVMMYFMHLSGEHHAVWKVVFLALVTLSLGSFPIMWDINVIYGL